MPYALFSNAVKVSKSFSNKADVWRHAADSGLVMEIGSGEEDPPRQILDMGYTIQECGADPAEPAQLRGHDHHEMSEYDIVEMIAACQVNRPSAGASS
ncbi:hypothetical protein RPMA_12215 [Tardiphaga alba]|uniref:Uncharacterized protein n=1 Tax=Tardiphaga alba TaxID=340268 RepID=A0ABX8A7T4_9BRAD|nr:hypothetical protein [Tardiphaga alba]QUS39512.1 hypothetical protein RPMA_12215 [Tardiphaga alba]